MSLAALVMAGGRGERMARAGLAAPKPLVAVRGVPLLERNLWALAALPLDAVVVAVRADDAATRAFVEDRGSTVAAALGWRLRPLLESAPLGNAGAAGSLAGEFDTVLLVYADNLTRIPLAELLAAHRTGGAALTLASHAHRFTMPYGALALEGDRVVAYREKPVHEFQVSSAVCALGPAALAAAATRAPLGLSDLTQALIAASEPVHAFAHDLPWVDVNDADGIARAEAMIDAHRAAFESWAPRADEQRAVWLGRGERGAVWSEGGAIAHAALDGAGPRDAAELAALAAAHRPAGVPANREAESIVLDDVTAHGRVVRDHVRIETVDDPAAWARAGLEPLAPARLAADDLRLLRRSGLV